MAKLNHNKNANMKMAEVITQCLRNSIEAHQQEIAELEGTIGFEEFSAEQASKIARIHELRRNEAGTNEIIEAVRQLDNYTKQFEYYDVVSKETTDLVRLGQDQIEELLSYVKEAVEKSGLGDVPMSLGGNNIIGHTLGQLQSSLGEQDMEKQQRIDKWLEYMRLTDNTSLSQSPDKQYSFMYGYIDNEELLDVSNSEGYICSVKTNGDIKNADKLFITKNDIKDVIKDVKTSDLKEVAEEAEKDSTKDNRKGEEYSK